CDPRKLGEPLSADLEYGWAKVFGEIQLLAFIRQYGMKGCSVRFITAYGPRENETHAIIALIYKAVRRMDPYPIWGNGRQDRDFTYVTHIVEGTERAAERITDGSGINLGNGRRYTMIEVANTIFDLVGWRPSEIFFDTSKPTGAVRRDVDIRRAREVLGWEPKGYPRAVRDAILSIDPHKFPVLLFLDGDGQYDPRDFKRLLAEFRTGSADIVNAYRTRRTEPLYRSLPSKFLRRLEGLLFNPGV